MNIFFAKDTEKLQMEVKVMQTYFHGFSKVGVALFHSQKLKKTTVNSYFANY